MRSRIQNLCVLSAAVLMLASCLGSSDNEVSVYDDMAVTAFTLGTLNRYAHTTSKAGADSVYKVTLTGSNYVMTIDQLNHEIYNRDSLPQYTDAAHVLCTITTRNGGVAYFKSLVSDTLWYYSSTDSIDFSSPRLLRIFATDGSGSRDYTVTLNVKQKAARTLMWKDCSETPDLWPGKKLPEAPDSPDYPGLKVVGSSSKELYALSADNSQLLMSADGGKTWTPETLDSEAALLPTTNLSSVSWTYEYSRNADYTLLVGNSPAVDSCQVVWRKIAEYDKPDGQPTGQWVYMTLSEENHFCLPDSTQKSTVYFDNTVLAFASNGKAYQSRDKGITWKPASAYAMPQDANGSVEATVDDGGMLWLRCTGSGKLWSGRME